MTHTVDAFGLDRTRWDGLAACCLASRRVTIRKVQTGRKPGWLKAARDGDKRQARARINYLIEAGKLPHPDDLPCLDCADEIFTEPYRHEYDHAKGYSIEHQLYVEPVCSRCHHNREQARG